MNGDRYDFLSIQFNKYGGSFIIEVGQTTKNEIPNFAKDKPFEDLNYGLAHPKNRIRIKPDNIVEDFWFIYENRKTESQFEDLVNSIIPLLAKVETFLRK